MGIVIVNYLSINLLEVMFTS